MDKALKDVLEVAVKEAVHKSGGQSALAKKFNERGTKITKSAISQWKYVPHKRVLMVEEFSGKPRQELRPDLYPKEAA